jgi:hypothetical protein
MIQRKRKISFYYIVLANPRQANLVSKIEFEKLLMHISRLSRPQQKMDINFNKFCLLSSIHSDGEIRELTFESATHSYRAPLLNRQDASTRDNPKTITEGDTFKTHVVLKYVGGDILMIAEKFRGGLSMKEIVVYLNNMKNRLEASSGQSLPYNFAFQIIAKDNIEEELENMDRVVGAEVFVDKQILGSEALNYSERIETIKEEIVIIVRPQRLRDMKLAALDLLRNFNGETTQIKKLRIEGRNARNNQVVIDTTFMEKREFVDAIMNEDTGVVDSISLFANMRHIINRP